VTQRVRGQDGRWREVEMPRCVRCGHEICACCADIGVVWCDHIGTGEDTGESFDECCDGECVVEVDVAEWRRTDGPGD
jgi:hypothetical protein